MFYDNTVTDGSQQFEYDAIYRLVSAKGREHASLTSAVQRDNNDVPINNLPHNNDANAMRPYQQAFVYDKIGNIEQMIHTALGSSPPPGASWNRRYDYGPFTGVVPNTNRLRSTSLPGDTPGTVPYSAVHTHDAHGNITSMPHLASIGYSPVEGHADP